MNGFDMAHILGTIFSVFSIIILGYYLKCKEVINSGYIKAANQVVFYIAIPAMMFNEISKAPFKEHFDAGVVFCLLVSVAILALLSLVVSRFLDVDRCRRGTFVQSSFHGNLGYLAFAIAYYALGESQFTKAAILSSFLMVEQNILSISVLTAFSPGIAPGAGGRAKGILIRAFRNPIIISVLVSIAYSASGFPVPFPIGQGLRILSGMALPTALLVIGASLSFDSFRTVGKEVFSIAIMKLICLPTVGYVLMRMFGTPDSLMLPGIILLAAPPATVAYVMAMEMGGDCELAATSVSVVTLLSAFTYGLFLWVLL
jgi:predicted permease